LRLKPDSTQLRSCSMAPVLTESLLAWHLSCNHRVAWLNADY
jgi:hypothetical protein